QECARVLPLVGMREVKHRFADQLIATIAEDADCGGTDIKQVELGIEECDRVRTVLDKGAKPLVAPSRGDLLNGALGCSCPAPMSGARTTQEDQTAGTVEPPRLIHVGLQMHGDQCPLIIPDARIV